MYFTKRDQKIKINGEDRETIFFTRLTVWEILFRDTRLLTRQLHSLTLDKVQTRHKLTLPGVLAWKLLKKAHSVFGLIFWPS